MHLFNNDIEANNANRAMIADATARFLAAGGGVECVATGKSGESTDPKKRLRSFRINDPDKPKKEPKPRRAVLSPGARTEARKQSIQKALVAKSGACAKRRELLAVKVAIQAALGDCKTKIANSLGVSHQLVSRIAAEHNITIGHKAQ